MEARLHQLRERAVEALQLLPQTPPELVQSVQSFTSAGQLADMIAGFMDLKPAEKQSVLELVDASARVDRVLELLAHRIEVLKLSREIETKTKATMDERQREYVLREQMRQIQKELGEGEGGAAELADLAQAVENAGMPEEVLAQAKKELKRLERMPDSSAEYSMVRTYLDWLIELPWKTPEPTAIDIAAGRRILDEDHYGLEKIKRRIIEFLAVRKLAPEGRSPILCFVGPPGVGKTSLGQSIARALGRKFVRDLARRRARRGGAPRPPAHLHRRAAGEHHPGDQEGRQPRLRDDARRGRQGRAGLPRRPERGAARGARPGAEQHVPRQLPRRAVRPLEGGVHHHRERARLDPGPAARPDGDHPPPRLHRGGEARDREALSRAAPARRERAEARPGAAGRRGASRRSSATTRARRACATSSASSARCSGTSR